MKTLKIDTKFFTLLFISLSLIFSIGEPVVNFLIIPFGILFVFNAAYCAAFGFKYPEN